MAMLYYADSRIKPRKPKFWWRRNGWKVAFYVLLLLNVFAVLGLGYSEGVFR